MTAEPAARHGASAAGLGILCALTIGLAGIAAAQTTEIVERTELRVCADPNNLPFSNQQGEGFENKIADVLGAELKLPVSYVWFPQTAGFVRNTLRARKCDLVLGAVSGNDLMETTNPYYHSGYVVVSRAEADLTATSLADPAFRDLRIGIIAATPPTDLLLRHDLMAHVTSYALAVDTRYESPARELIQAILDRQLDVGLIWGPIAGYYAHHDNLPLRVVPLAGEPGAPRLDYRIAMGVRANEPEWRRTINAAAEKRKTDITRILLDYGVPLLDEQNRPIDANGTPP
jgi:quinoprotein dehydrogenase-associated probable ABC transporter substrate-binding protein